ncbi:MAG TPA: bifunctional phosphopantothenoylcysteine decarboxylase/phosphopantothenate--cysteine ligase CoaBC [Bryobacteraceae bacterium]
MKIALGVSGGIAAYKAAEIVRLLQEREVRVQVVMTRAAQEFVRPLTFAALSGEKVITGMFEGGQPNVDSAVEHISVAQAIDALLVAPATADLLAKFAHGIADDFLTTLYLATSVPVIVAPAMNVNMWEHPATRANLETLRQRGVHIVEPGVGYLACGMVGAGRLAEPEEIVAVTMEALGPRDYQGETVLITAGPTREPVDPVRFLTNRSSGKMGYALAEAAAQRGARVLLVSGPTALHVPSRVEFVPVETVEEMRAAVLNRMEQATIIIKAAAVSDYRLREVAAEKIKRQGRLTLDLEGTADILKEVAARRTSQTVIGFAAETTDALGNARRKLADKGLQAIVLNDVSQPGIGFDSDRNAVTIITSEEEIAVPESSKAEVAQRVLDVVHQLRVRQLAETPAQS